MPVTISTVTWRQALAAVLATVLTLGVLVLVVRSDGLPAVEAASSRATRWFVHQPSGRAVLVDGYGGRALASVDAAAPGNRVVAAEGGNQAYVLDDTTAELRSIDSAELRLGPPQALAPLGDGVALARVGASGLVVANPSTQEAVLLASTGELADIDFRFEAGGAVDARLQIAPDATIWSVVDGDLIRSTSAATTVESIGADVALSLVGNQPLLLDRDGRRVRLGDGDWQSLPDDVPASELVLQRPGPTESCGWVGADDRLWCVGRDGIEHDAPVADLAIDGSDHLAIAGDVAVLVRRGPTEIVHFDWRSGTIIESDGATVGSDARLEVTATVDLVWVDEVDGDFVWSVHPWGIEAVDKSDGNILVLGEDGEVVDEGASGDQPDLTGADDGEAIEQEQREPDDNGVDDPPLAFDDPVTARSGGSVPVTVTANDYDPDGEAIAVSEVGVAGRGTVEIASATTVVYTPEPGFVGADQFEYVIVDGDGTEARANVLVQLLPTDATNQPPVGASDRSETGPNVPVVVDVLLNDIDPERDSLRLGSVSPPSDDTGEISETVGPSGLPALQFEPREGFEGIATFSYRPVDSFDAVGDDVTVTVEVARDGDANRPPIARPDALRTRRDQPMPLPVLVNDRDPDGDPLTLSVVRPLPDGLEVELQGDQLEIIARPGVGERATFEYQVDDGNGHTVRAGVLVEVIDDVEANRPPVTSSDVGTAVVGQTVTIDVLRNDLDPDGDPLRLVEVSRPEGRGDTALTATNEVQFTPSAFEDDEESTARFTYVVTDGRGHEVVGDVTVTVLAEPLPVAPYAQDDSTFTFVDEPVTIDVLRNDGDPSGERPTIVGTPGCASGGQARLTADEQVRYDPPPGRSGAFRCTYEVTNSRGLRDSASITISVREPLNTNRPPIASLDAVTVDVGETRSIDVLANDRDPDGDAADLRVISSTAPVIGSAVRSGNRIVYTAPDAVGFATIEYQIQDAEGAVATGRVSIRVVEPENVAPEAFPDPRTVEGGGTPVTVDPLANDEDVDGTPGDLVLESTTLTSGEAVVSVSGRLVTITPAEDFVGTVVVAYTISDPEGLTDTSAITLTVLERANRPPVAADDAIEIANGGAATVAVLFNDSDPDGDPLTMSIVGNTSPSLGTASVLADQSIRFTAAGGQSGSTTITYQVSDPDGLTDTAALRVTVLGCVASAPVAGSPFLATGYLQPITVDLASFASNGTVVDVAGPPTYVGGVYSPPEGMNGNATISYAVVNDCGQRASGTVTIDVNQDPVADPVSITMGRNEVREVAVSTLASDDEPLTIASTQGAPTWVVVQPSMLTIDPPNNITPRQVSFDVTVTDPGGLSTVVPVTVSIVNLAPKANPDAVDASAGRPVTVDLVANDTDPDGDNATLAIQSIPSSVTFPNGESASIEVLDGRRIRLSPGAATGVATFQYTVVDEGGAISAPATVTVTAPAANTPPFADDQSVAVAAGVAQQFVLDAGDVDGTPVTVVDLTDSSGVITARTGLTVTVTAPSTGTFTVTYRVSDGEALSRLATFTVVATAPTTTTTTTTIPATTTTTPTTSTTTTTVAPPAGAPAGGGQAGGGQLDGGQLDGQLDGGQLDGQAGGSPAGGEGGGEGGGQGIGRPGGSPPGLGPS